MKPVDFCKTLYLGDRYVESILIDGSNNEVKIMVNRISRIRSRKWDYYDKEDLEHGYIVLEGVKSIIFDPQGPVPNDYIEIHNVEQDPDDSSIYNFEFCVGSGDKNLLTTDVKISIKAKSIALESSGNALDRIRE